MEDKTNRRLARVLGLPGMFLLAFLALVPAIFAVGSKNEGEYYPVVVNLIDDNETPDVLEDDFELPIVAAEFPSPEDGPAYVDILLQFDKVRNCDFLIEERVVNGELVRLNRSLTWNGIDGRRLRVEFEPDDIELPDSRPRGEQVAGPWRLHGTRSTEGTTAIVAHRCHPLWLTYSQFYP